MGRLNEGENQLIDEINRHVKMATSGNKTEVSIGLEFLLDKFAPMIISLCNKWAEYFADKSHELIEWAELTQLANNWFITYTVEKYKVSIDETDGKATYNNFIKKHMDSRIRFIFEQEIARRKKLLHPDPDKNKMEELDPFEDVIYKYSTQAKLAMESTDVANVMFEDMHNKDMQRLGNLIMEILESNRFTDRERILLKGSLINGKTFVDIGLELGISRTRVSQLTKKAKAKLQDILLSNEDYWRYTTL